MFVFDFLDPYLVFIFFFFNDTATTEIYTLSLHDALPISGHGRDPDAATSGGRGRGKVRSRRGLRRAGPSAGAGAVGRERRHGAAIADSPKAASTRARPGGGRPPREWMAPDRAVGRRPYCQDHAGTQDARRVAVCQPRTRGPTVLHGRGHRGDYRTVVRHR